MYPKINQNIMLEIAGYDQTYRSMVAEFEHEEILIAYPMDGDWFGALPDGTALAITYILSGSVYRFHTKIVGRKNEKIRLYRVAKPAENEIKRVQRRDNFRVEASLAIQLNGNKANTINLSAGGVLCAFGGEMAVKEGEIVSGTLEVPNQRKESETISFQGQIKRIDLQEEWKQAAIEFTDIHQRDQMKIVQYCFERQRQNR
ncbi:flagellar brake protein [Neobacillus muris]|uniref:flagellar brake protein n=1 Tax=Neobacillus muris TaxID=2941334 RepID=UPI002040994D|nr:flagellar brake domain-containing protein [Neobacillus muris]